MNVGSDSRTCTRACKAIGSIASVPALCSKAAELLSSESFTFGLPRKAAEIALSGIFLQTCPEGANSSLTAVLSPVNFRVLSIPTGWGAHS